MRKMMVAVLFFVTTAAAAQTTYEVQGSLYSMSVQATPTYYSVRVTDRATSKVLADASFPLDMKTPMTSTFGLPDGQITVQMRKQGVQLMAMLEVERGGEIVDAIAGSWATKARPKESKMSMTTPSPLSERYPSVERLGGGIKAPVVVHRVEPSYSEEARKARVSGIVILETLIDEQGNVSDVAVLKPLPFALDVAAVNAVKQWRFEPATKNGVPVPVIFNLTVNFKIDEPLRQ